MSAPPPAAPDAEPLSLPELAVRLGRLGPFEARPVLAVGVSGGADSLALTLLAQRWVAERQGSLLALVVDHGLRAEAAAEAARAVGWLTAAGIQVRTLTWTGPKPSTGVQAAARAARYRLLEAACRSERILHLLLAHHADDQAETVAMRAGRGSGPDGLAGMAAVVERPGLRLLRPLLDVPKARLVATLRALGQPWIEDPSNRERRYRRAALRHDRAFSPVAWWQDSAVHAAARAQRDEALARFFARHAEPHPLGQITLYTSRLEALAEPLRAAALSHAVRAVAGRAYPVAGPWPKAIPAAWRATRGGCILTARGDRLVIAREPGRIVDRRRLLPGETHRWDHRFLVRYEAGPGAVELAALSEQGRRLLPAPLRASLRTAGVSTHALASLPALWAEDELVACLPLLAKSSRCDASAVLRPSVALMGASFFGVNVVSNHYRPIYPASPGTPDRCPER